MFTKASIALLVGAVVVSLLATVSSIVGTYKVKAALEELQEKEVTLVEENVSAIVLNELAERVEENQKITTTSLERLEALKNEVDNRPNTVTVIKTEVVQATPQKDSTHENLEPVQGDDLDVALRAIDELWLDYCKRFPSESDCRNRENIVR